MRVGIIDLGTNSVRFDIHELRSKSVKKSKNSRSKGQKASRAKILYREKLMVKLGQGVFTQGRLDETAIQRTVHAFQSFAVTAKDLRVDKIIAFATSALREATDREKLIKTVAKKTGVQIRVISGQEEAKLIAKGILANERGAQGRIGRIGLIDIGGGSTEISVCQGKEVLNAESFALGTARIQQLFLRSSPPKPLKTKDRPPIQLLREHIRSLLYSKILAEKWPKPARVLASSGTAKALARLCKEEGGNGKTFDLPQLKRLIKKMTPLSLPELLGLPGMEAKRADMILGGAVLLEECCEVLGCKKIWVTDFSLRDGILSEEAELLGSKGQSRVGLHREEFFSKAIRLGAGKTHLEQVEKLSLCLFDNLASLHKMPPRFRSYLQAAALLHDVGETISPVNHGEHSAYIVKHGGFASAEPLELELIAMLCRHHGVEKLSASAIDLGKNSKFKSEFLKCLALLRLSDALDRAHKGMVKDLHVKIDRSRVTLKLTGSPLHLEVLRAEQKKDLFEKIFKRRLVFETKA